MLYKNMNEALQDNAYTAFTNLYGVEAYSFHPKVWSDGWKSDGSVVICSKMQCNIAAKINGVSFNGDFLEIQNEQDGYRITISPKGRVRYSFTETVDEYTMQNWVERIYPHFQEVFQQCR